VDTEKLKAERQLKHIQKISGLGKKTRNGSDLVHLLTTNTRAKKALDKEA
jgi:carbon-monoxide dehydrogenase iron sulfur subunit